MPGPDDRLLRQQIDYYRARAAEYDEWFLRRGRYDHGPELNRTWFDEVDEVRAWLDGIEIGGAVLEIACGTGNWTERLAPRATRLTALDASPEMIAINR
ncbi:MAG: class I SAM-dependent methyltransferase, partial [Acidobacteriota bacterium]|nr:class I SAM-dependent methyltransferase [Acidobacteriota bacterium]